MAKQVVGQMVGWAFRTMEFFDHAWGEMSSKLSQQHPTDAADQTISSFGQYHWFDQIMIAIMSFFVLYTAIRLVVLFYSISGTVCWAFVLALILCATTTAVALAIGTDLSETYFYLIWKKRHWILEKTTGPPGT